MATYSNVKTWSSNETLTSSDLNAEFNNIITNTNSGNLNSDNVSTSAAWTWTGTHTMSTSSKLALIDNIYVTFGSATDGDYFMRYSASNTALELSTTNADGSGTNAVVLDIQDGTDDVRVRGGLSTDNNAAPTTGLLVGGNIVSDTDSTDDLGTTSVRWANVYTDAVGDSGQTLGVKATTLSFDAASTIDTSGNNALTLDAGSAVLTLDGGTIESDATTLSFDSAATIDTSGNNALSLDAGTAVLTLDGGTIESDASTFSFDAAATIDTSGNNNLTLSAGTATIVATAGDITIFDDNNNADTSLSIGTSATEALVVQALNGGSNKTLEELRFTTKTASSTGDYGKMTFYVDETEIATIDDGGIDLASGLAFTVNGTAVGSGVDATNVASTRIATFSDSDTINGSANLVYSESSGDVGLGVGGGDPHSYSTADAIVLIGSTSHNNTELALASSNTGGSVNQITFSDSADTSYQSRIYYNHATGDMGIEVEDDLLVTADRVDFTDTNSNHVTVNGNPASGQKGIVLSYDNTNNNGQINALHTGTEYRPIDIGANANVFLVSSSGNVGIGTTSPSKRLELTDSSAGSSFDFFNTSSTQGDTVFRLNASRSANSAYNFFKMYSGSGFGDTEFAFRGDGNAYADGSFSGSGADYQEFFESTDGTALEIGISVVMDGEKVRAYNASSDSTDNIVGVVRPKSENKNSAVIGNTAWNHWTDKYLTNDYGVYLREDVTVWEWDEVRYVDGDDVPEDKQINDIKVEAGSCYERDELAKDASWTPPTGATSSKQSVRKLNPDYDASRTYTPREERTEWNLIGLLGQVQIKANEPVRPTWIKMKQISESVDLYLVR